MKIYARGNGRITIPAAIRRKLDIRAGTRILVHKDNGNIMLQPITREYAHSLRGKHKGKGLLMVLMAEKKREREL